MLSIPAVRRIVACLRRPFMQRLITLVVSVLLAISLISLTSVPALPPSGHDVASSASNQFSRPASAACLQVARILTPKTDAHGQEYMESTERERRSV